MKSQTLTIALSLSCYMMTSCGGSSSNSEQDNTNALVVALVLQQQQAQRAYQDLFNVDTLVMPPSAVSDSSMNSLLSDREYLITYGSSRIVAIESNHPSIMESSYPGIDADYWKLYIRQGILPFSIRVDGKVGFSLTELNSILQHEFSSYDDSISVNSIRFDGINYNAIVVVDEEVEEDDDNAFWYGSYASGSTFFGGIYSSTPSGNLINGDKADIIINISFIYKQSFNSSVVSYPLEGEFSEGDSTADTSGWSGSAVVDGIEEGEKIQFKLRMQFDGWTMTEIIPQSVN